MKAAVLTIGDELLNGQTIDTNSAWIGQELNKIGITLVSKLSVGDTDKDIRAGLEYCYQHASLVIVTGGLGPTNDDITKQSLATFFDCDLTFSQVTYDRIVAYFEASNRQPTDAHRQQCYLPSKAELVTNERGTAPGMWMNKGRKFLLSMPGVPSEMKGLMLNGGLEKIAALNPDQQIHHHIIQTVGIGETYIAEKIKDIVARFPDYISIAYLPGLGSVKLRLTAIGPDKNLLIAKNESFGKKIADLLGDPVYATGAKTLQQTVGEIAKNSKLTIGTAESCTGGHIAQLIASVPGASSYYKGSVVAYSNDIKENILNVSSETLKEEGAVCESTVKQMVSGLVNHLNVDVALAVSGIAGPTGGSKEKPVGTIWMAVGNKEKVISKKLQLSKTRDLNIKYTNVLGLDLLRRFLLSNHELEN